MTIWKNVLIDLIKMWQERLIPSFRCWWLSNIWWCIANRFLCEHSIVLGFVNVSTYFMSCLCSADNVYFERYYVQSINKNINYKAYEISGWQVGKILGFLWLNWRLSRLWCRYSGNFSIRFWRQYVSLFTSITAIVPYCWLLTEKSSH